MRTLFPLHKPVRFAVAFVFACSLLTTAHGQPTGQADSPTSAFDTGGLTIEAIAGWDDTVDTTVPVPLSFDISNYSGKDIDGVIVVFDPLSEQTATLGPAFVGQGGTSRFTFIRDLSTWHDCYAALFAKGEVLWRRQLPIATGIDFDPNTNFVLFLDVQGRTLPLKDPQKNQTYYNDNELHVAPAHGRPVRCLSGKPWQIPRHPGPLSALQAVIIQDDETANELNPIQWRALAEWMCQGGTIFASESSALIREQLVKASPLGQSPPVQLESFSATRVGLGSLRTYSSSLLNEDSEDLRSEITGTIARLDRNELVSAVRRSDHWYRDGKNSSRNRLRVLAFFAIYTLLTGIVPLVFFRIERKRIAILTTAIVLAATVMAGLLGAFLRTSEGDLNLITVAELSAGGAVEVANINVQSAGGRDTEVAIRGNQPDLQFTGRPIHSRYNYYGYGAYSQKGYAPFTWQSGQMTEEPDLYQINVPMTPWGRRQLFATGYQPDWKGLDIAFEFLPGEPTENNKKTAEDESASRELNTAALGMGSNPLNDDSSERPPLQPAGKFKLRVVNHLPIGIKECNVVIGIARQRRMYANALDNLQRQQLVSQGVAFEMTSGTANETFVENATEYQFRSLRKPLAPGDEVTETFPIHLNRLVDSWDIVRSWPHGAITFRTLTHAEQNGVWIVGRLSSPATLKVDEDRTDFLPDNSAHYFVQRVPPEDLPDLSALMPSDPEPSKDADSE